MKKAVLISIRPEWCQKIASGEKTIEVRKNRPKLAQPFKCYIYCTRDKHLAFMQNQTGSNLIACMDAETAIHCAPAARTAASWAAWPLWKGSYSAIMPVKSITIGS